MQPETLSWTAEEFERKDRHPDWVWTAGFISLAIAVISFFYGNFFFGIFVIIAGGAVIYFALREPKMITVTLKNDGILIEDHAILYTKIDKFWIDESGQTSKLLLSAKTGLVPIHVLPLANVTSEQVRSFLKKHCTESEITFSLVVKIFDRLGF